MQLRIIPKNSHRLKKALTTLTLAIRNIPGPDSAAQEEGTEGQQLLTNSNNNTKTH